jgi:hypothetical protein
MAADTPVAFDGLTILLIGRLTFFNRGRFGSGMLPPAGRLMLLKSSAIP